MSNERFERFLKTARRGRPESAAEAPLGFATRVAARWAAGGNRANVADLWERLCWWGASAAVAICLLAMIAQPPGDETTAFDDMLLGVPQATESLF